LRAINNNGVNPERKNNTSHAEYGSPYVFLKFLIFCCCNNDIKSSIQTHYAEYNLRGQVKIIIVLHHCAITLPAITNKWLINVTELPTYLTGETNFDYHRFFVIAVHKQEVLDKLSDVSVTAAPMSNIIHYLRSGLGGNRLFLRVSVSSVSSFFLKGGVAVLLVLDLDL